MKKTKDEIKAAWGVVEHGHIPPELRDAANALSNLAAEDEDAFLDELGNDTAQNYSSIVAAFEICRTMLDELERLALQRLANERAWHQQIVQQIEALGVLQDGEVSL